MESKIDNLLIDTNIFLKYPLRINSGFRVISKLCKAEITKLYVPIVIKNEFCTHIEQDINKVYDEVLSKIKQLKKYDSSKDFHIVNELTAHLLANIEELKNKTMQEYESWIMAHNVNICDIQPTDAINVFSAYFKGEGAFSKIKNREDFPDAFIYERIKDIAVEKGQLSVITEDKNLMKAISKLENVIVYDSIGKYISSEEIQMQIKKKFGDYYEDDIRKEIEHNHSEIEEKIHELLISELINVPLFEDDTVDNINYISNVLKIEHLFWSSRDVEYYGDGLYLIPFNFSASVKVSYKTRKNQLLDLLRSGNHDVSIPDNDIGLIEGVQINGDGVLTVQIDENNATDVKGLIHEQGINIARLVRNADYCIDKELITFELIDDY